MIKEKDNPPIVSTAVEQFSMEVVPWAEGRGFAKKNNIFIPDSLSNAVDKRVAEFVSGRFCAERALEKIGIERKQNISIDKDRSPVWPYGVVGSITHTEGFVSAAVAHAREIVGVGIDSEKIVSKKTFDSVKNHLTNDQELERVKEFYGLSDCFALTLIFSAKESIFKALYPLVKVRFYFKDAVIFPHENQKNLFSFSLCKSLSNEYCQGYRADGKFSIQGETLHTGITLLS